MAEAAGRPPCVQQINLAESCRDESEMLQRSFESAYGGEPAEQRRAHGSAPARGRARRVAAASFERALNQEQEGWRRREPVSELPHVLLILRENYEMRARVNGGMFLGFSREIGHLHGRSYRVDDAVKYAGLLRFEWSPLYQRFVDDAGGHGPGPVESLVFRQALDEGVVIFLKNRKNSFLGKKRRRKERILNRSQGRIQTCCLSVNDFCLLSADATSSAGESFGGDPNSEFSLGFSGRFRSNFMH